MTIVPTNTGLIVENSAISLARYAQLIGYSECEFFGVAANLSASACRDVWTLPQRLEVAKYLASSQALIEQNVGYPWGTRRWFSDPKVDYRLPVQTTNGYVIEAGVRAETVVSAGAAVNHATDPAVVGPIATTVADPDEVTIYHPGTTVEIHPSAITIAGGLMTIEIPRCRMVVEAEADNPEDGLDYTDLNNFESTVDVARVFTDPSTQATLISNHRCSTACASAGCSEYTQPACMYIANGVVGTVEVYPASYSSGAWVRSGANCCTNYRWVSLNYRAGRALSYPAEDAILRLAHSLMPDEPCGCDVAQRLWKRDRNIPEVLTRERLNCTFGLSDGAWSAWKFAKSMKPGWMDSL